MNIIAKLDKQKHRNIMKNILIDIYKDFSLGTSLVFKGGTASYFFYNLDRFSTDLDFDLILENNLEEDKILEKINSILSKYGEVKRSFNKKNTIFSLLSYGQIEHNIKIEISKRGVSGIYDKKTFFGVSVLVMTSKSIFTNKLFTILNRASLANRDIYDIWFFFKNDFEFDIGLLEEKVGKNYLDYFKDIIYFLENISKNHSILSGLGEVLTNEKHKTFVKNDLLKELIDYLRFRVEFDLK